MRDKKINFILVAFLPASIISYVPLLFFCALLAGCNNGTTSTHTDDTQVVPPAPADGTTCYAYRSANDTIMLTLTTIKQNVSGSLVYAYSEKDKNSGTITGIMKGDTLLVDYTFMSEGTSSVRQVAFLRKGDGFVEGYGDSKMQDGKMVFENTGGLEFSSAMTLQKVPCGSL